MSMDSETRGVPQRVAVIGGGAVGCYMAAEAYAAGHQVTLCLRTLFERLIVETFDASEEVPVTIAAAADAATDIAADADADKLTTADWVLITTKAQDTPSTQRWLDQLVDARTVIVLLQNGVNHEERLVQLVHQGVTLPGLVYVAVERVSPGRIVHRGGSRILVPDGEYGERFQELLRGSHTEVVLETDFLTSTWKKLLSNLAANPITALTLQRIGIMQHPDVEGLARELLLEGVAVARAVGAKLGSEDVEETLDFYARFKSDGGTSMLYDRLSGRPLEHEYITGAVVSMGEKHGIPTPINRVLLTLLRQLTPLNLS